MDEYSLGTVCDDMDICSPSTVESALLPTPLQVVQNPIRVSQIFDIPENGKIRMKTPRLPTPEELKALRNQVLQDAIAMYQVQGNTSTDNDATGHTLSRTNSMQDEEDDSFLESEFESGMNSEIKSIYSSNMNTEEGTIATAAGSANENSRVIGLGVSMEADELLMPSAYTAGGNITASVPPMSTTDSQMDETELSPHNAESDVAGTELPMSSTYSSMDHHELASQGTYSSVDHHELVSQVTGRDLVVEESYVYEAYRVQSYRQAMKASRILGLDRELPPLPKSASLPITELNRTLPALPPASSEKSLPSVPLEHETMDESRGCVKSQSEGDSHKVSASDLPICGPLEELERAFISMPCLAETVSWHVQDYLATLGPEVGSSGSESEIHPAFRKDPLMGSAKGKTPASTFAQEIKIEAHTPEVRDYANGIHVYPPPRTSSLKRSAEGDIFRFSPEAYAYTNASDSGYESFDDEDWLGPKMVAPTVEDDRVLNANKHRRTASTSTIRSTTTHSRSPSMKTSRFSSRSFSLKPTSSIFSSNRSSKALRLRRITSKSTIAEASNETLPLTPPLFPVNMSFLPSTGKKLTSIKFSPETGKKLEDITGLKEAIAHKLALADELAPIAPAQEERVPMAEDNSVSCKLNLFGKEVSFKFFKLSKS
jgi:hypothetical protein